MVTTTEARAALPELLDRVGRGEEITITRHGRPVAVLVRPDALRTRRAERALSAASDLQHRLAAARSESDRSTTSDAHVSPERADELVADVRAERDADRPTAGS